MTELREPFDRSMEGQLDCEAHRVALSSALDGEIDPTSFGETLGHLACCEECRRFVARARELDAAVVAQSLTQGSIEPKPVANALWKRIAAEAWPQAGSDSRARVPQRWAWGLAAALLVTLAGLGLWNSVTGGGIAQEAMTEEGSRASEFARRSVPADAGTNRVVNDSGRQLGGNPR